jgi:hypothetical protein
MEGGDLMYKVTQLPLRVQILFNSCDSAFVLLHTPRRPQGFFRGGRISKCGDTWRGSTSTTTLHADLNSKRTPLHQLLNTSLSRSPDEARLWTAYPVSSVGLVHRPSSAVAYHPDQSVFSTNYKVYPFSISCYPHMLMGIHASATT